MKRAAVRAAVRAAARTAAGLALLIAAAAPAVADDAPATTPTPPTTAAESAAPVSAKSAPTAVIERLDTALVETMKQAGTLDAKARYERLAPVVSATYDFERMVAIIAGSAWTSAEQAQRTALVDAFRRFSIANYVSRFNAYKGEQFKIIGQRPGVRDTVVVETRLERSDGPPVAINYIFEQHDGQWKVIDVLAERAISELALRRSEYAQTLREGGLAALTAVLNTKSDQMLAKK